MLQMKWPIVLKYAHVIDVAASTNTYWVENLLYRSHECITAPLLSKRCSGKFVQPAIPNKSCEPLVLRPHAYLPINTHRIKQTYYPCLANSPYQVINIWCRKSITQTILVQIAIINGKPYTIFPIFSFKNTNNGTGHLTFWPLDYAHLKHFLYLLFNFWF